MAKARQETEFNLNMELPRVTVSAVDTFYSPATPYVDPSIRQLASSLQGIVPSLSKYSVVKEEEKKEVAKGEAAVAFRKNNMLGFKRAVKEGKIPEGANPYFVEAYVQQELVSKANQFKAELYAAWKDEGIVNNTAPNAFEEFFARKSKEFRNTHKLDGYDAADIVTAFIPNADAARSNLFERHINERMELVSTKNAELLANNTVTAIDNNIEASGKFDVQGLGEDLTVVAKDLINKGMNGSRVNQILIDTITERAQDLEDDTILDVLNVIKTKTGTLAETAYAQQKIDDAETNILSKEIRKWNHDNAKTDRELKEYRTNTIADAIKIIQEDGIENFDVEKFLKDGKITDGVTTSSLYSLTNTIINAQSHVVENEKYVTDILIQMNSNINDPDLMDTILNGIGTEYSLSRGLQLFGDYQRKRESSDHHFLLDTGYRNLESSLRTAIKKESLFTEEIAKSEIAVMELNDFAITWIEENPQGTKSQFKDAVRDEWSKILKVFVGAKNFKEVETFQQDLGNEVIIDNEESKVEEQGSTSENLDETENVFSKENEKNFENVEKVENKKEQRTSLIEEIKSIQSEMSEVNTQIEKLENSPKKNKTALNALMQPLIQKKATLTAELSDLKKQLEKLK